MVGGKEKGVFSGVILVRSQLRTRKWIRSGQSFGLKCPEPYCCVDWNFNLLFEVLTAWFTRFDRPWTREVLLGSSGLIRVYYTTIIFGYHIKYIYTLALTKPNTSIHPQNAVLPVITLFNTPSSANFSTILKNTKSQPLFTAILTVTGTISSWNVTLLK